MWGGAPRAQAWTSKPLREVKTVHTRRIKPASDLEWITYGMVKEALVCKQSWGTVSVGVQGFRVDRSEDGFSIIPCSEADFYLKELVAQGPSGSTWRVFCPDVNQFLLMKSIRCNKDQRKALVAEIVSSLEYRAMDGVSPTLGCFKSKETGDLCVLQPYYEARSVDDLLEAASLAKAEAGTEAAGPADGTLGASGGRFDNGVEWQGAGMSKLFPRELGEARQAQGHSAEGPRPQRAGLEEDVVVAVAAGAVEGLHSLHGAGRAHGSLSPRALLIDVNNGRVLVDGPGTYRELGLHVGAAKPLYCAPELLVGPAKSDAAAMAADIWALGASLLECVRGASPFRGSDGPSTEWMVRHLPIHLDDLHVSAELRDFMERCLARDPTARPTAAELLAHPLMRRYNSTPEALSDFFRASVRAVMPGVGQFGGMQAVQVFNRLYSLVHMFSPDSLTTAGYMYAPDALVAVDGAELSRTAGDIAQALHQLGVTRCQNRDMRQEVTGVIVEPAEGEEDHWRCVIRWALTAKPSAGGPTAGYHRQMVAARYEDTMVIDARGAAGEDPAHGATIRMHASVKLRT